jgi:hypothetical protein
MSIQHACRTLNFINTQLQMGTVPIGKRLVIEQVGIRCDSDADDSFPRATINVYQKTGGGWSSWQIPIQFSFQGTAWDGKASWIGSQALGLYSAGVNAGTYVDVHHKKITATAFCVATLSGYTVDEP